VQRQGGGKENTAEKRSIGKGNGIRFSQKQGEKVSGREESYQIYEKSLKGTPEKKEKCDFRDEGQHAPGGGTNWKRMSQEEGPELEE